MTPNKPTYSQLTFFAKQYFEMKRSMHGDSFATEREMEYLREEPWAWLELWEESAAKYFCLPDGASFRPNHKTKRVRIQLPRYS